MWDDESEGDRDIDIDVIALDVTKEVAGSAR